MVVHRAHLALEGCKGNEKRERKRVKVREEGTTKSVENEERSRHRMNRKWNSIKYVDSQIIREGMNI